MMQRECFFKRAVGLFFWILVSSAFVFGSRSPQTMAGAKKVSPRFHTALREDLNHDTGNLRANADFEIEVAEGVYWIPANKLGRTHYTNQEIAGLLEYSPEQKRDAVRTLYEAIQLYQIGDFRGAYDNQRISENGINWEHHKPGYHAVRTNEGCCASDSSWLAYLLQGDYEEIGIFAFSQADGNGHIMNYLKHCGWYYMIDMMQYRNDSLPLSGIESGRFRDYLRAYDPAAGNFHKVRSLIDYAHYCRSALKHRPDVFVAYTMRDCVPLPLESRLQNGETEIMYPENSNIQIVFEDSKTTKVRIVFKDPPKRNPDWSVMTNAKFHAVMPKNGYPGTNR